LKSASFFGPPNLHPAGVVANHSNDWDVEATEGVELNQARECEKNHNLQKESKSAWRTNL